MKLPTIVGNTKQEVEKANFVRAKALKLFERSVALTATHKVVVANVKKVGRKAIQQTDAKWWNDRYYDVFTTKWPIATVVKLGQDLGIIRQDGPMGW